MIATSFIRIEGGLLYGGGVENFPFTNFHGDGVNGVEVDLAQHRLVASYGNVDEAKVFATEYIYMPIFTAIGCSN